MNVTLLVDTFAERWPDAQIDPVRYANSVCAHEPWELADALAACGVAPSPAVLNTRIREARERAAQLVARRAADAALREVRRAHPSRIDRATRRAAEIDIERRALPAPALPKRRTP